MLILYDLNFMEHLVVNHSKKKNVITNMYF
jgi:hypothetical protein